MMQLSGQDAAFLHVESAAVKTHFTVVTVYDQSTAPDGTVRYRDIVAYFDRVMAALPIFRRRLQHVPMALDAPYLIDDPNFHIESHIRHFALPAPNDWRQLCILAAQIQAQPMDLTKPLWDMTVVEGLNNIPDLPKGSFALLTRLHHSVADGSTVRGLLMALHQPAGKAYRPDKRYVPQERLGLGALLGRAALNNLRQTAALESAFLKKLPVISRSIGNAIGSHFQANDAELEHDDEVVPNTLFNQELTYRRSFQVVTIPLAEIQEVRHSVTDVTVNDIVMSVLAGGLQAYLEHEKAPPKGNLYALCMVNLRADKFSNDSLIGNNLSMLRACLHTESNDPIERLQKISADMRASKKIQNASSTRELIELGQNVPYVFVSAASRMALPLALNRTRNRPITNAVITNVPGPQQPLYFLGAEMVLLSGIAPLAPGTGITIGVISYNGKLAMSVTGCPEWIPDPQALAACIKQSFAETKKAAAARKSTAKNGRDR